jgi:hypothetical protein
MGYASTITRSSAGTVEVSRRKRQVRAIWSTDEGDHYRTAFVQSGIDTSAFAANPVILFEHSKSAERGTLPIANAVEFGPDRFKGKNVFIGSSRFWDDPFADARFEDYAAGRMRGWSINVVPLESSPPTKAERQARADWRDIDIVYRSTRLLEVSATAVPGNPSTLTLSVERNLGGVLSRSRPSPEVYARVRRMLDESDPRQVYARIQRAAAQERREYGWRRCAGLDRPSLEEACWRKERERLERVYRSLVGPGG